MRTAAPPALLLACLLAWPAPSHAGDATLLDVLHAKRVLTDAEYERLKGSTLSKPQGAALIELLRAKGVLTDEEVGELSGARPAAAAGAGSAPAAAEAERRLGAMEQQLQTLSKVPLQVGYEEGFFLRTGDGKFSLRLNGRVANHFRFQEPGTAQDNSASVDRGRFSADVRFYKLFRLRLEDDFTASAGLRDAFVAAQISPAFNLQVGQFKVRFSYEGLRSKRYIDFVERAAVVGSTVNPSRDVGVMAFGELADRVLAYQLAVMNGAGQNQSDNNSDKDVIGRLVVAPFATTGPPLLRGFNFGGAATYGRQPEVDNSIEGETETRFVFFEGLARRGDRLRTGGHVAWFYGPYSLSGEYIHTEEERQGLAVNGGDLPDLDAEGAYFGGTWMLTGETKPTNGRVHADAPLVGIERPGLGAWELALRYEFFKLRHAADAPGEKSMDNRYDGVVAGVNWYPNELMRLSLDYLYGHFDGAGENLSPNPAKHSNNAVLGRVQFEL